MAAKKKMTTKSKVEIGAGVLASAAALAAGYYFYASKDAKNHRKIAVKWAGGLKAEVLKEAQKIKKLGKAPVMQAVDKAVKVYAAAQGIDKQDVAAAAKELKNNWQNLVAEVSKNVKGSVSSAKKTVKKPIAKAKSK